MESDCIYERKPFLFSLEQMKDKNSREGAEVLKKKGTFCICILFFQRSNGMNFPSMCVGQSIFPAFLEALFRYYRKLGLLYQFSLDIIETWVYFINFYYLNTFLHWSLVVKTMITFNIPQYRMFILSPASFNI